MREPATLEHLRALRLVDADSPSDLVDLYAAVTAESATPSDAEFLTVRDVVELSGRGEAETHALLLAMLSARANGSLCVPLDEPGLAARLAFVVGSTAAAKWAARVARAVEGDDPLPGLAEVVDVGLPRGDTAGKGTGLPVVLQRAPAGAFAYFERDYLSAVSLAEALRARRSGLLPAEDPSAVAAALADVARAPVVVGGRAPALDAEQLRAVGLALYAPLTIVSGGPGTGKTFIVHTLLRVMARLGYDPDLVRLAAPSGRAAQRMTDAVGEGLARIRPAPAAGSSDASLASVRATTIHRLLGYNPSRQWYRHHAGNQLPARALVVDEVSMVDVELMVRLLAATPPEARVVLLGDKDQLPSVGSGAVLADLMPAEAAAGEAAAEAWLAQALDAGEPRPARKPKKVKGAVKAAGAGTSVATKAGATPAGRPLHDIVTILQKNYRSQEHIRAVADAIRTGSDSLPLVEGLPEVALAGADAWPETAALVPPDMLEPGGVWLARHDGATASWRRVLELWGEAACLRPCAGARSLRDVVGAFRKLSSVALDQLAGGDALLAELFAAIDAARVLTVLRRGPYGCEGANEVLTRALAPVLDPGCNGAVFGGLPVMVTRNEHALELYNGDVGAIVRTRDGALRAVFRRGGRHVVLPVEALPAWEPAFATTVHKAQGSEYDMVLVSLPPQGGVRIMTREIVYTAITRARRLAVIHGTGEVLAAALDRRVERETGISLVG